ncbi:MAG: hypothetical protein CME47_01195 [Halieaceae bacterium]|jgi:hypothetical protein|nr:hypothetical protein [Halieaceae bacterium]|tara:strand:+ start:3629 stop:4021 length:393 start_codon:yes stop_codon:yes gene_type:complete
MSGDLHPLAPHALPPFVGGADGGDPLFSAITFIVIALVLIIGVFYLKLHAIPEQLAHKHSNTQSQLIMVLALLALFTHNNIFWVAALILALLKLPDFLTPINSISDSLKKLTAQEGSTPAPKVDNSGEGR